MGADEELSESVDEMIGDVEEWIATIVDQQTLTVRQMGGRVA
jgi:hypothetical protein